MAQLSRSRTFDNAVAFAALADAVVPAVMKYQTHSDVASGPSTGTACSKLCTNISKWHVTSNGIPSGPGKPRTPGIIKPRYLCLPAIGQLGPLLRGRNARGLRIQIGGDLLGAVCNLPASRRFTLPFCLIFDLDAFKAIWSGGRQRNVICSQRWSPPLPFSQLKQHQI